MEPLPSISPLAGKISSHVINPKHFAETMKDVTIGLLVSFDVTSLYNVPIGEAVEVICDTFCRLREDEDLVERTQIG